MTTDSPKAPARKPRERQKTLIRLGSLAAVDDATWVDSDLIPGLRLKVRPLDWPAYTNARTNLFLRLGRTYKREAVPEKVRILGLGELYARHLLAGWDGLGDDDGREIPHSEDKALELLTDWDYRRLIEAVEAASSSLTQANVETVEAAAKNSEPRSATT